MCSPTLRARLAADPNAAPTNPIGAAAMPARNLGVTLAAFPGVAASRQPPGLAATKPTLANDQPALNSLAGAAKAGPLRPAPSGQPVTRADKDDPLAAIMQGIRRDEMRRQGDPAPVPTPPDRPRAPVQAAPVRQAPAMPVAPPNPPAVPGAIPVLQRRWPVPGYHGRAAGTPAVKNDEGPNGLPYSDGRFDPTGVHLWRGGRRHMGYDLPQKADTPVQAAADGVVSYIKPQRGPLTHRVKDKHGRMVKAVIMVPRKDTAGNVVLDRHGHPVMVPKIGLTGYGNRVWIDHPDGTRTTYNHLRDSPTLALGARVKGGQVIGVVGNSGNAETVGTHLHFEVQRYDRTRRIYVPIDPAGWINGTK